VSAATPRDESGGVLFRVDGSERIGAGHLVRCLAIANELMERGIGATFLVADTTRPFRAWIRDAGHELLDQQDEKSLYARGFRWVVVDHYGLEAGWIEANRDIAAHWLAIDDLADRPLLVDILVNPNPWAAGQDYADLARPGTRLLLGLGYAPIRRELVAARGRPRAFGRVERVLVALGGGSSSGAARTAIVATRQALPDVRIDVVSGPGGEVAPDRGDAIDPGISVRTAVSGAELATLMATADLAIGAGGTSSWERCLFGLPAIVVQLADNQAPVAAALAQAGAAVDLGRAEAVSVDRMAEVVCELAGDPEARKRMSDQARQLVDGRGAVRIANILEGVQIRTAIQRDSSLLWTWANDSVTRANSFDPTAIPKPRHEAWFAERLADPRTLLLIGENSTGPVGQVRFDLGATVEVSISVAPDRRDELLGELLLEAGLNELRRRGERRDVLARVKPDNQPSRRLFEAAGFRVAASDHGVLTFVRPGNPS
jgi:UDP-2,4-diacetamido-2,4,6-trideoxy-beta-L-altropyranose hydrolase